jgi:hypothetical protein
MCTHEFDAHTGDKFVLLDEDRMKVATPVDRSAVIQGAYNKCTDEESKRKLAMEWHAMAEQTRLLHFFFVERFFTLAFLLWRGLYTARA